MGSFDDACTRHGKTPRLAARILPHALLQIPDGPHVFPLAVSAPHLFNMDALFNETTTLCPGRAGFLPVGEAPDALCLHPPPKRQNVQINPSLRRYYDQYWGVEKAMLARWLQIGRSGESAVCSPPKKRY